MPVYSFYCDKCEHEFDKIISLSNYDKPVFCEMCNKVAKRQLSTGITGGVAGEPWHYSYTHDMKPKFVIDNKGNKQKFNPGYHTRGKKGSGN